MPDSTSLTNSRIVAAYREYTPGSERLAAEAGTIFPSGITHDSRQLDPYALYVARAKGSRKWDVDGHEYVDYFGGHGAMILGHCHPRVMEAVHRQLDCGTHFGASNELEVRWGALVKQLFPTAERVRFTSSGTEANLMAIRLARAYTGRSKIVRFLGHFHGWQDHVAFGVTNHFDGTPTPGVLPGIAEHVLLAPPDDIEATRAILENDDDIACVILEPTGASFGQVPLSRDFVAELRRVTAERGIVLIFDEVVSGFRASEGGAQAIYGIKPDMTSLAKILAGGLPGGATTGRADIFDQLDFEVSARKGKEKIGHQGTFNANPISASAGVATLSVLAEGGVCAAANARAADIRNALNEVFTEEGVRWSCYGEYSAFHIFTNPKGWDIEPKTFDPTRLKVDDVKGGSKQMSHKFRLAMILNGVDVNGKPAGLTSGVHTADDVDITVNAVRKAIRMLKEEGDIA
ncbi:MAG: aspartate aminotransferase family protein [Alphaproteobacteria bacterium]